MVDHLTRVTIDVRSPHAEDLAAALSDRGFAVRRAGRRIVADSSEVEGQDAKAYLRARGFGDREYQMFVEFVRRWGIL